MLSRVLKQILEGISGEHILFGVCLQVVFCSNSNVVFLRVLTRGNRSMKKMVCVSSPRTWLAVCLR